MTYSKLIIKFKKPLSFMG